MKKQIFLITISLFLTSCFKKEGSVYNPSNEDSALIDTVVALVDSSAATIDTAAIAVTDSLETKDFSDYEIAEKENTSLAWKKFLLENPNYEKVDEIRERIIRLEVQEIMNDENTGKMPESDKVRNTKAPTSSIEITNDTSCELVLRYSGEDAISVSIPSNSIKKISISSGNYSVAASACSYNYAGMENINGDYAVTYYISSQYR